MGFRQIHNFNLAMLAKQGWRLVHYEDSLLAQVLKAGYYPSSDFMQASLGYNPSYTWRSIHAARQVLHKGLCWRIGNGRSVRIWKDGWLPKQCGFRVWSRSNLLDENATVDSLLQEDGLGWNIPLLEQVLLPFLLK